MGYVDSDLPTSFGPLLSPLAGFHCGRENAFAKSLPPTHNAGIGSPGREEDVPYVMPHAAMEVTMADTVRTIRKMANSRIENEQKLLQKDRQSPSQTLGKMLENSAL